MEAGIREKKQPAQKLPKGTVAGHYSRFLSKMMDEMDRFPEMTNHYIVMDNAPIHGNKEIEEIIEERGYRSVYLPPYSPELNPIEQFWSVLKDKVKRSQFGDTEDLKTRISEASQQVPIEILKNIIKHTADSSNKCLNMEPI